MFRGRFSILSFALLLSFWALADSRTGAPVLFSAADVCELAMHPPDEIIERLAQSYRGLLEFGGDEFSEASLRSLLLESTPLEKFFEPVPGRDQRSVALNESLTKLGDWVILESEDHGLTHEQIVARLREVVRAQLDAEIEERESNNETREELRELWEETSTGARFYPDRRFPELGVAWRDPSGMVWGTVVRREDGSIRQMFHEEALKYCQSIGAELPSQQDFIRLREYMGAQRYDHAGYVAQIIPDLAQHETWSADIALSPLEPFDRSEAIYFFGVSGLIARCDRSRHPMSFRCVMRTQSGGVP